MAISMDELQYKLDIRELYDVPSSDEEITLVSSKEMTLSVSKELTLSISKEMSLLSTIPTPTIDDNYILLIVVLIFCAFCVLVCKYRTMLWGSTVEWSQWALGLLLSCLTWLSSLLHPTRFRS